MTVELWVYLDTLYSVYMPLVSSTGLNERNQADGFGMKFESGLLFLRVAASPTDALAYWVSYSPPIKQWIHLSGSFDGSVARVYVNGEQVTQFSNTQPIYYGSHGLSLGTGFHSDFGNPSFLRGMLDEVRIWSYARSQTQIQQSMTRRLRGDETGLVGYWNFDGPEADTLAYDLTSHKNNGTYSGAVERVKDSPIAD